MRIFHVFHRKNRRIRPVTACMRRNRREKEKRIAEVERMTEFSYLTAVSFSKRSNHF